MFNIHVSSFDCLFIFPCLLAILYMSVCHKMPGVWFHHIYIVLSSCSRYDSNAGDFDFGLILCQIDASIYGDF